MVGSIILVVLGVLVLIGLGNQALKDFNINSIAMVILIALIVGLNFIPVITVGYFSFRVGTLILYALCVMMFIVKGKWSNKMLSLLLTAVLAGLIYGSTRLSLLFDNAYWGGVNVFYGLIAGFLALMFTRNAKYAFISAVISVMTASLLTQIGGPISLEPSFNWAVVAGATAVVLYTLIVKFLPSRPNKMSYYFEAGRMLDED